MNIEDAVAKINTEYGVELRVTCPYAPVQVSGAVGNKWLYFRYRWDEWTFTIADDEDDAVSQENYTFHVDDSASEVFYEDISGLTGDELLTILDDCFSQYYEQVMR